MQSTAASPRIKSTRELSRGKSASGRAIQPMEWRLGMQTGCKLTVPCRYDVAQLPQFAQGLPALFRRDRLRRAGFRLRRYHL